LLFESADFDINQTHDPTIPVVIAVIKSYVGKGNWRKHLMIERIVLKNRTSKAIKTYKLAWIIMSAEDQNAHVLTACGVESLDNRSVATIITAKHPGFPYLRGTQNEKS
jgi:hypothetical protein